MPGLEQASHSTEGSASPDVNNEVDSLTGANLDGSNVTIEDAATPAPVSVPVEQLTSSVRMDASHVQPPLTPEEIQTIARRRGQEVTDAQVAAINMDRARGIHV